MTPGWWTVPRMIAGAVVVFGLGIVLGLPFASRAQQPAAPPTPPERFRQNNWQTDEIRPLLPNVGAIFLGADAKDYTAHLLGATRGIDSIRPAPLPPPRRRRAVPSARALRARPPGD